MKNKNQYTQKINSLMIIVAFLSTASLVSVFFDRIGFPETNIVIVYLFSVVLISRFTIGYAYGVAASIFATLLFNYLFTSPYFTLTVDNPSYIITFAIMTTTAVVTSALTTRTNQNKIKAEERESETKALYDLTSQLTDALDINQIARVSSSVISKVLECQAGCLPFNHKGNPEEYFLQTNLEGKIVEVKVNNKEDIKDKIYSLRSGHAISEDFYDWPIYGQEKILGIIRVPKETAEKLDHTHKRLLLSMIENTALAMDRVYLAEERLKSNEETTQERHRGNLLRGISHDLRTPLSGIMVTSEMLMGMTDSSDKRYEMMEAINNDANWLRSLVENVLSLTRLQDGKLSLTKENEAIEEIIDEAIRHITKRVPNQTINVEIPDEVLLVPVDGKLILQVFINLIENAVKHTKANKPILINVAINDSGEFVQVKVIDQGKGINEHELEEIFKPFYTSSEKHADSKNRIGLGLAICNSIISAHGGIIYAQNRSDGDGAELVFTLPLKGDMI